MSVSLVKARFFMVLKSIVITHAQTPTRTRKHTYISYEYVNLAMKVLFLI